jgi:hypothetical protein
VSVAVLTAEMEASGAEPTKLAVIAASRSSVDPPADADTSTAPMAGWAWTVTAATNASRSGTRRYGAAGATPTGGLASATDGQGEVPHASLRVWAITSMAVSASGSERSPWR